MMGGRTFDHQVYAVRASQVAIEVQPNTDSHPSVPIAAKSITVVKLYSTNRENLVLVRMWDVCGNESQG